MQGEGEAIMVEDQGETVCAPVVDIKRHISPECHAIRNNARNVERGW